MAKKFEDLTEEEFDALNTNGLLHSIYPEAPKEFIQPKKKKIKKQNILDTISDLCSGFLYYDRKEDEDLSMDQLNEAVKNGVITIDEMVAEFRKHLENTFNDN